MFAIALGAVVGIAADRLYPEFIDALILKAKALWEKMLPSK